MQVHAVVEVVLTRVGRVDFSGGASDEALLVAAAASVGVAAPGGMERGSFVRQYQVQLRDDRLQQQLSNVGIQIFSDVDLPSRCIKSISINTQSVSGPAGPATA